MSNKKSALTISRKKLVFFTSVLSLIIVTLGFTIYYLLNSKTEDVYAYDDSSVVGLMPGVDRESMLAMLQENADNTAIAFSINSSPVMMDKKVNLLFENPDGNGKDLTVVLMDNESQEMVYQSKAIREGSYLTNIELTRAYEPGEHTIIAYIAAFAPSTHEKIGEAAVELTLSIEEQ